MKCSNSQPCSYCCCLKPAWTVISQVTRTLSREGTERYLPHPISSLTKSSHLLPSHILRAHDDRNAVSLDFKATGTHISHSSDIEVHMPHGKRHLQQLGWDCIQMYRLALGWDIVPWAHNSLIYCWRSDSIPHYTLNPWMMLKPSNSSLCFLNYVITGLGHHVWLWWLLIQLDKMSWLTCGTCKNVWKLKSE